LYLSLLARDIAWRLYQRRDRCDTQEPRPAAKSGARHKKSSVKPGENHG